ncbi:tRNA(Arg) A34 adenosine deaminase TadA [Thermocatellispora tengchongensis]|uniref:tRNA(Arg) A34 adenosine deaminase TadA n=1 Tax=Thermocatellispora tengchongensis TaxID=1073253 RepID=A0A840PIT8_9ACTN|nr:nucleoside deaminase [Thermocatellispora tengchongensis]MBB5137017.1 tRNA(Arg) A34 adenosine deaminase TadA [Thermocatellispora tengchongensis]
MDERHLRRAVELAREAAERGDGPYGAVLVDAGGRVAAEARNAVAETGDVTTHAEIEAVRAAGPAARGGTMYASGEPCAMCAGAMSWAGVARVVFGASIPRIREVSATSGIGVRCAHVLATGPEPVEVVGPVLEEECLAVFRT